MAWSWWICGLFRYGLYLYLMCVDVFVDIALVMHKLCVLMYLWCCWCVWWSYVDIYAIFVKCNIWTAGINEKQQKMKKSGPYAVCVHGKGLLVTCRVHTHGTGPCFFHFFAVFLLIPCISNIAIDNKVYTHIIFNITSPNTTGTPQIHQTHIFMHTMHYIESIVHPHKLHRVHI